jgi:HlyD family secretion protein
MIDRRVRSGLERLDTATSTPTNAPNGAVDDAPAVAALLERNAPATHRRRLLVLAALVLIAVTAGLLYVRDGGDQRHFATTPVERGDIVATVSATGVLSPLTQVDVGSEVSGVIDKVFVDFNDHVKRGQLLARLNTDQLRAHVLQAKAELESAKAGRSQAQATTHETQLNFSRCERLARTQMCSQQDLDQNRAALLRAQAAEEAAGAAVAQAAANLDSAQTALDKADIVTPIDGIVLNRYVEPGQTVAATFQTPVLFTIAEDLSKMQIKADVDEADIGHVAAGQSATFTVDAYPGRKFPASVRTVRYAPKTVDGVVTYEAVLDVDNSALLLRPGMTATVDIVTQTVHDVWMVPNAALRLQAPADMRPKGPPSDDPSVRTIWLLSDDETEPRATEVHIGAADDRNTAIVSPPLQPGMRVVTDMAASPQPAAERGPRVRL